MASLPDFAPELIIHVFESLDKFQAIAALSSTSQKFNGIWRPNNVRISKAIRLHAIDCLPDAEDLLKVQGRSAAEESDICQSALEHKKSLFSNAKEVLQDSKAFEKHLPRSGAVHPTVYSAYQIGFKSDAALRLR